MFRNQYDTDVTTFSPVGRLHQVEYALEAVKQGSAAVGLRSKHYVVVASLKRQAADLGSYQKKIFDIDDHMGIAIAGLIADARQIAKWMRSECLNHRYAFDSPMPTGRLVAKLSDKSQVFTQKSEKRPYGVGLLVAGLDSNGPHLYQTDPSGNFSEYKAYAMGARSQASKTYLEKHFEKFDELPLDDLIYHALSALKGASQGNLNAKNVALGFVGRDHKFTIIEDDDIASHVARIPQEEEKDVAMDAPEKSADEEEKEQDGGNGPFVAIAVAPPRVVPMDEGH